MYVVYNKDHIHHLLNESKKVKCFLHLRSEGVLDNIFIFFTKDNDFCCEFTILICTNR